MPLQLFDAGGVRGGFLYLVLLLAIPLQYYLSNRISVPEEQREANFRRLMKSLDTFRFKYLSVSSWQKWCLNVITKVYKWKDGQRVVIFDDDTPEGECPALEVFRHKSPEGYFSASTKVRAVRPKEVKYRVGQVVKHKLWGYKGVIVGWDTETKAPESWINQMHPPDKWNWKKQPNYSILVDTADRKVPQATYVPQENIEVIAHHEVNHPRVFDYFDSFDGAQYIMRPAIKYFYPRD